MSRHIGKPGLNDFILFKPKCGAKLGDEYIMSIGLFPKQTRL